MGDHVRSGSRGRSIRYLAAVPMAVAVIVAACTSGPATTSTGGGATASAAPKVTGHPAVTARLQTDWGGPIHPAMTANAAGAGQVIHAAYDTLTAISPTGEVLPYLAASWTTTPSSVTFTLKKGATCADGAAVTPTVVAESLRFMAKTSNRMGTGFGPGPYTVESNDAAGTVTFSVAKPNNELLYGFHWYFSAIVCPAGLQPGADFMTKSYGSGPFVLQTATRGQEATLKRRPEWSWGPQGITANDPGFPDTLTFKVIANETTAANLLLTKGLDFGIVSGPDQKRLEAEKSITTTIDHSFVAQAMVFNEEASHATSDIKVREALMTAVDPKAYNQAGFGGTGQVTSSIFTPRGNCYDPKTADVLPNPPGDVNKARSILTSSGWTVGANGKLQKDGKPLTLVIIGFDGQLGGPEYLLTQFTALGATASVMNTDNATWVQNQVSGKFDVMVPTFGNSAPVAAFVPSYFSDPLPPAGLNRTRTNDPELDRLLATARSLPLGQQCPAWSQYQQRLLSQRHLLPLAAAANYFFTPIGYARLITDGPIFLPGSMRSQ